MKEYVIHKIAGTPDWASIPTLAIDLPYENSPADIGAWAQIAYGEDAFYLHLFAEEEEVRAVEFGPLGSPCEDSCLEFFFCPMEGDDRYFNIEFNVNGCLYLGLASGLDTLVRLLTPRAKDIFAPDIRRTEKGWEIFYRIPFSFVRRFFPDFEATGGKVIRANCFKCADLTTPPHYFSWSPIVGEPFTYHKPHCFGKMILQS